MMEKWKMKKINENAILPVIQNVFGWRCAYLDSPVSGAWGEDTGASASQLPVVMSHA